MLCLSHFLAFAVINGHLIKKKLLADLNFNPRTWVKWESVIAFLIFSVTGFMNNQTPPHIVAETLKEEKPSWLFSKLFEGQIHPSIPLQFNLTALSVILAFAPFFCYS